MKKFNDTNKTPLAGCANTEIKSNLLEALLVNKRKTEIYRNIVPITGRGHQRGDQARQVLSYILRRALGVVRVPGTYDIKMEAKNFSSIKREDLEDACNDAIRIYKHTQDEMTKHIGGTKVRLVRGIDGKEAEVCSYLLDRYVNNEIPFFLSSVTFFNHVGGPFDRSIELWLECPVEWVWASAYTLKDLELPGGDEEFLVVCKDERGTLCVPKNNFKFNAERILPITTTTITSEEIPKVISKLVHDGFEPDDYRIKGLKEYRIGYFERNLTRFGYYIDRICGKDRCAILDDNEMH